MRSIEAKMLQAIKDKRTWTLGNTSVFFETAGNPYGSRSEVYLHGNHIATVWHQDGVYNVPDSERLEVNVDTLARWPSVTTKSRLRALGANVVTKNGVTYLDDKAIT